MSPLELFVFLAHTCSRMCVLDMLPQLTQYECANVGATDTKSLTNHGERQLLFLFTQSDSPNGICRKFCDRVRLTAAIVPLAGRVCVVFCRSAGKEVVRVNTWGVVAVMADRQPNRFYSGRKFITEAVRIVLLAAHRYLPISLPVPAGCPDPTRPALVYTCPKVIELAFGQNKRGGPG